MKTKNQKNQFHVIHIKSLIVLLVISFFSLSCNNDDEKVEPIIEPIEEPVVTNPLFARWKLVYFNPNFFADEEFYSNAEVQWTINENNTIDVVIVNGVIVNGLLPLKETGSYNYIINNNVISIFIVGFNQYENFEFEINNNELIIEDLVGVSSDGRYLKFEKM